MENSRKHLVPAFVMEILENYSGKDNHCTQEFIRRKLSEKPYEVEVSRQTLGRHINTMLKEDMNVFGSAGTGYWYDPRAYLDQCDVTKTEPDTDTISNRKNTLDSHRGLAMGYSKIESDPNIITVNKVREFTKKTQIGDCIPAILEIKKCIDRYPYVEKNLQFVKVKVVKKYPQLVETDKGIFTWNEFAIGHCMTDGIIDANAVKNKHKAESAKLAKAA